MVPQAISPNSNQQGHQKIVNTPAHGDMYSLGYEHTHTRNIFKRAEKDCLENQSFQIKGWRVTTGEIKRDEGESNGKK